MAGFVLTDNDFRKIYKAVYKARANWRPLGIELDMELSDLDAIEREYRNTGDGWLDRCLEKMIRKWLKSRPKLQMLIAALKSQTVDEEGVACDIEEVSPENCYVTGRGIEQAEIKAEANLTLHASASVGQEYDKPITNISCELIPRLEGSTVQCSMKKGRNNTYEIRYTPTTRGRHQLHVKVGGEHVKGSPFTVVVKAPIEKLGTPVRIIYGLQMPCGVAVNERGEIVTVEGGEACVSILSPKGRKIKAFGSYGSGPGQFDSPKHVAIDHHGNILVADYCNHRIQKFSPDGKFIESVGTQGSGPLQFFYPIGIATSQNGRVYVCENHRVQVLNPDLTFCSSYGGYGTGDGQFWAPYDAAVDSRGNVYVVDSGNHRIQVFTGDGHFLRKFGSQGEGNGELLNPESVAIDSVDMVFVIDCNRVSVFTSLGRFTGSFKFRGCERGLVIPWGIAVDRDGFLYVSAGDYDNQRILIF